VYRFFILLILEKLLFIKVNTIYRFLMIDAKVKDFRSYKLIVANQKYPPYSN
jgi:hypothetical protein